MLNPEFLRNVWLEMSWHRLIGLPVVIVLVCLMAWLPDYDRDKLAFISFSMAVLPGIWGMHLVAESLLGELRGNTWHAQRMSALSAWQLAWGKLFGSTLFAWSGAGLCLLIYAVASPQAWESVLVKVLLAVLAGLLMQSVVLLLCLVSMGRNMIGRSQSFAYILLTLITFVPVFISLSENWKSSVDWYGSSVPGPVFAIVVTLVFYGWSLAGVRRLMAAELQIRQGVEVWLGFLLCFLLLACNMMHNLGVPGDNGQWMSVGQFHAASAAMIAMLVVYGMMLLEDTTPMQARRWLLAWQQGDWQALHYATPCWLVTWLVAAACLLVLAAQLIVTDHTLPVLLVLVSCLLFVLRDCALLLWMRFRPDYRPAHTIAMVIYLLCSYTVLPVVLKALDADLMLPWLIPGVDWQWGWICVAIEAVTALWLLRLRCQSLRLLPA